MQKNSDKPFYPSWALLVTGFSCALFAFMLSLINGHDAPLFCWISGISFGLGLITGIVTLLIVRRERDKPVS